MARRRFRTVAAAALMAVAGGTGGLLGATPAVAAPVDRGNFVDHIDETFDCDGTLTHQTGDVHVAYTVVQRRGAQYYRESVNGFVSFTNLDTGGSYSNKFAQNGGDHAITANPDGTITIVNRFSGVSRWFDKDGNLVLTDSGTFRASVAIDLNGTPDDPEDDVEVPGSFELTVPFTGHGETDGRGFCDDLRLFT